MKIEWKKTGADIQYLLREISKGRTINKDGSVSTTSMFAMKEWESVIFSFIRICGVSDTEARELVAKAIIDHQVITQNSLEIAIRKHKAERDRICDSKYRVIFPVLGLNDVNLGRFQRNNVLLNFSPARTSRFYRTAEIDRRQLLEQYPEHLNRFEKILTKSSWCVATVSARSATEAYELAYREIRIILGLVVFMETPPQYTEMSFGNPQPVARVHIPPQMTVHTSDGKLAFEGFWHVKNFSELLSLHRPSRRSDQFPSILRDWLKKLSTSVYPSSKVEDAVIKYYDAFSDHSIDDAFLGGWRVLEHVAGNRDTKYNQLIERASAFYDDPKLAAIYGYHLSERRNSLSHGHEVHQEHGETVMYQMNRLLHPILKEFIINPRKFGSIEEFHDFCDLSWNETRRIRLAKTLGKAIQFRKRGA